MTVFGVNVGKSAAIISFFLLAWLMAFSVVNVTWVNGVLLFVFFIFALNASAPDSADDSKADEKK